MQTVKKIFLLGSFFVVMALLTPFVGRAQKKNLRAIAGPKGIWVICGEQLPKKFSYVISRQKNEGDWVKIATVTMPRSKDEIQATLVNTENAAGIAIAPLSPIRLQNVWERINTDVITESPPELSDDLPLRAATGTAWYDAAADSATIYRYKIQVVGKNADAEFTLTNIIKYPVKKFATNIRPASVKVLQNGIHAEFEIVDKGQMTHCKVLRSYYLRSGFEEINVQPLFMKRGAKMFVTFTDDTAEPKVPYTYTIVPIDAVGNPGFASPEIKAYDVMSKSIVPSVHQFKSYSDEGKRAIRLGWKLDDPKSITTIDIYKSDSFNGQYTKIASVAPTDTSYSDPDVNPIVTYFYTVKLNGQFEVSPTSPRIPGILRAVDKNAMPPQNVLMVQDGNSVTLKWQKTADNTHAYMVYRANGATGELKQLSQAIVTDSVDVSYTDKLPDGQKNLVYTYAVASENTSYVISSKSKRMYAYSTGNTTLPIPYNVSVRKLDGNKLMVIWPDMWKQSTSFAGYMVYRSVKENDGKAGVPQAVNSTLLKPNVNFLIDNLAGEGVYYYSVRTVGLDQKQLSSPSLEAGYTLIEPRPSMVSNIKIIPSVRTIQLSWNTPVGQNIESIQISRAIEGREAQPIATLAADKLMYIDKDVTPGTVYYYLFTTKNKAGKSSNTTDPMGVSFK